MAIETTNPDGTHHIEIKDADAIQQRLAGGFNWIEDNARLFIALIAIAIIAAVAYVAIQFVRSNQEKQAQAAYYTAEAPFLKLREGFERAKFAAFAPPEQAAEAAKDLKPSGDISKDYGTSLTAMEAVARDHAGTSAGSQAALIAGETYLSYKQPDKAIELAQIPATKLGKDHTLSQLGRILWGNALASKGDCQGAVGVWQPLIDQASASYLQADVSLRSGLCFEELGQNDRAMEMYRKATAGSPDAAASTTAKGLLRALELKTAQPAAAPSTAPAAKNG